MLDQDGRVVFVLHGSRYTKAHVSRAQSLNLTPSRIVSDFCLLLTSTPPEIIKKPKAF